MERVHGADGYTLKIFATGMHMLSKYGSTLNEVKAIDPKIVHPYINQSHSDSMDRILAKTILGLSDYVDEDRPDLIVIHGDRVEALAGAIVGSLKNIRVAHIEGGEVSGTIDEVIRHSVSKLAHHHFVCNEGAQKRLMQMGEKEDHIHIIGSPDIDAMLSPNLPSIANCYEHYGIDFSNYYIVLYHPVTTNIVGTKKEIRAIVDGMLESRENFIVIFPNNDDGSDSIIDEYQRLEGKSNIKIFPSIRFEYFLTLLKNSSGMIGNSSAGVREAPLYGIPTLDIGTRQMNRSNAKSIVNVDVQGGDSILELIESLPNMQFTPEYEFGFGDSADKFMHALSTPNIWSCEIQKIFIDIDF
jgi:UDP-N-acetylglucosamine 2-epimerase (hydrolysing)